MQPKSGGSFETARVHYTPWRHDSNVAADAAGAAGRRQLMLGNFHGFFTTRSDIFTPRYVSKRRQRRTLK
jgi:hypothetical protein